MKGGGEGKFSTGSGHVEVGHLLVFSLLYSSIMIFSR